MRDGETCALAVGLVAQHAARAAAMPVQRVSFPPEERRRAVGLAVDHVGNVAEHRGVEQAVNLRPIIGAALVQALDPVARRQRIGSGGLAFDRHGSSSRDWSGREQLYRRIWSAIVPIPCEKFRPILRRRGARPSFRSTSTGRTSPKAPPRSTGSIRRSATPSRAASPNPASRCRRSERWQNRPVFAATPSPRPMSG